MPKDVEEPPKGDVETPANMLDNSSHGIESFEQQLFLGFPMFIFINRWIKKYASPYTRIGLLVFGIGVFLSRQMKGYLGYVIKEYMMSRAEVREGDEVYMMLLSWVSRQRFSMTSRNFVATTGKDRRSMIEYFPMHRRGSAEAEDSNEPDSLKYTPSQGLYPFWYKGNLFFFRRNVEANTVPRVENLSVSCFGRNPQSLKKLLEECRDDFHKKDKGKTIIYNPEIRYAEGHWVRGSARTSRDFATVVLDSEIKASIIKDLDTYLNSKQRLWYAARGIPYRRGYLLHGPPGTGKSSLSFAIAGYFKLKIYVISLGASNLSEEILTQLFSLLPSKCVVLMEDVDAAGLTHQRTQPERADRMSEKNKISLSALLNVIDGVASQEGRVLIMTTNHVTRLDAALIRPGRVDMMVEFKNAEGAQLIQIFEGIYKNIDLPNSEPRENESILKPNDGADNLIQETASNKAEKEALEKAHAEKISTLARNFANIIPHGAFTPAEIQGYLLRWKDEPETAVENAAAWVTELTAWKAAAVAAQKEEEEEAELREAKVQAKAFKKMMRGNQAAEMAMIDDAPSEQKPENPSTSATETLKGDVAAPEKKTEESVGTGEESTAKTVVEDMDTAIEQLSEPSDTSESSLKSSES